jgi:hypothetical protein
LDRWKNLGQRVCNLLVALQYSRCTSWSLASTIVETEVMFTQSTRPEGRNFTLYLLYHLGDGLIVLFEQLPNTSLHTALATMLSWHGRPKSELDASRWAKARHCCHPLSC